ncbi:MAG TPA: MCT family MFS transporter [Acidimicrobiales bacterium]|nr:MCT family MFS transporter [Acidimicrobiales bacterium]
MVADASLIDGRHGWITVGAGFVSMATVFGVAYSFGAFFAPMADEFGASRSATSAVFSITACLYFLLGVVTGPAVDRVGPRPVLLAGAVALGVGLLLTSFVDRLWLGYVTYGLGVGIGVACGYVPMVAVVGGWFLRRRAAALGTAVAGIGIGTLAVAPLAASLIDHLGWRATYRVLALGSFVALAGCAAVAKRPPRHLGSAPADVSAVRSPAFAVLYVTGLFVSLALFLVFIFLTPFAEEHGVAKVTAAALVGIVGAASVVGRLGLGFLSDRLGSLRTYRGCFLAIALSYVLWMTTTTLPWLVTFAIVFGVAYGGFIALSPAVMADLFGTAGMGRLMGLLYTSAGIGALVGPPLAGFVIDRTGSYRWATGAAMALALIGWAGLWRLRPPAAAIDPVSPGAPSLAGDD